MASDERRGDEGSSSARIRGDLGDRMEAVKRRVGRVEGNLAAQFIREDRETR